MLIDGTNIVVKNSVETISSKNSGGANNMLVDGRNIEVENSVGATISKDSGVANNMLVDGRNIEVENSEGVTRSKNSGGANNMLVDGSNINIKNSGGGFGSNNSGGANNLVIKGENINLGDSAEASLCKNSGGANNLLIKGENINLGDSAEASLGNNSCGANNIIIKGSDINYGGAVISKRTDDSLRSVIIPQEMVGKFRMNVESNTDDQLETSAILLGKESKNEFTITHLLFLPQNENQDSCVTDFQEKLLAKQDELGLIELGWISTHSPMDSTGFRTCFGIQQVRKEAIAIVVPRDDDGIGIYLLTTLKFIANSLKSRIPIKIPKGLLDKPPRHVKFDSLKVELMDLK
jgi:hypothetical protein